MTIDHDYAARFAEALVSEIKAEMGRRDIRSSRALGRITGHLSQYVSDRLDGGNSKTGKRVILNARDIAAFASAVGLTPEELVSRASAVAKQSDIPRIGLAAGTPASAEPVDLHTVVLDADRLAATKKQTAIDPGRGEA